MSTSPKDILLEYWGHNSFRPQQEEIIKNVLLGKDSIALLPTGGGKSVCFQLPALMLEGITIVVSPLIALMKDQVLGLQEKGIKALAITSGLKHTELDTLLDNCIYGNYKLLYLSPERLQQELVQERIKQMNVSLIAVDEAHCISQWGHDFRPAYRDIAVLRTNQDLREKPLIPIVALTATATPKVLEDIHTQLLLEDATLFKTSYHRPNLIYKTLHATDKSSQLLSILESTNHSAIVYVRNRKATVNTASYLTQRGITATSYHGGMTKEERHKKYLDWRGNKTQVMVGTSAFGMGIDKPDVDVVVHLEIPDSIENYFQEAGRAGRSGQVAQATLLYNENDLVRLDNQFVKVIPQVDDVKKVYKHLCNYFQISYGEGQEGVHRFNFGEFCTIYKLHTSLTFNCLNVLDRNSVISLSQEFSKRATINFKVMDFALDFYLMRNKEIEHVVKAVLRTYGAVFEQVTTINYNVIAKKANASVDRVHQVLLTLDQDDIIDYEHKSYDTTITFLVPREDDRTIHVIAPYIKTQATYKLNQVRAVKAFIANSKTCRAIQLMVYFDEVLMEACGNCDVCLNKKTAHFKTPVTHALIDTLTESSKNARDLLKLQYPKDEIIKGIRLLLDQKKIQVLPNNTYKLL